MSIATATRATGSFFRDMWTEEGKVLTILFGILVSGVALGALLALAAIVALILGAMGIIPMGHGGGTTPVYTPVHVIMPRMPAPIHVG